MIRRGSLRRFGLLALLSPLTGCGARTALGDQPYEPASLYCTDAVFSGRPSRDIALVVGLPHRLRGLARWSVVPTDSGVAPRLVSDGGERATFQADREGRYTVRVAVTPPVDADAGDAGPAAESSCTLSVEVRAAGPVASCPAELTVAPLQVVTLTARAAGDRPIRAVGWSVAAAPASSARRPPEPADSATARFTPDTAGDHRLRFRVVDDNGASDECSTVVHAVPREGLRVELSWDPPGRTCPTNAGAACDDSDVDLHLLQGVGDPNWRTDSDCYYGNCARNAGLRWGATTLDDDPRLDIDDVTGHGPENVNIVRPSARYYRVGVHYYRNAGGPQAASLAIYCDSPTPVARLGPITLVGRNTPDDGDFWIAADVLPLPGGGCRVAPIARSGAPWIVRQSEALTTAGPPAP